MTLTFKDFKSSVIESALTEQLISPSRAINIKADVGRNLGPVQYASVSGKLDDLFDLLNDGKNKEAVKFIREQPILWNIRHDLAQILSADYELISYEDFKKITV
jgi:hypothetical protein